METETKKKSLTLVKVAINPYTRQSKNESVVFEQIDDDSFEIQSGAVDQRHGRNKARKLVFPMSDWESRLSFYERKGFAVTDTEKPKYIELTEGKSGRRPIKDKTFEPLLRRLINMNDEMLQEMYAKKIRSVSSKNIARVQDAITELAKDKDTLTVPEFNEILMKTVWTYVPRQMNDLEQKIAHHRADFDTIVTREQEILDTLCQALKKRSDERDQMSDDILTANHIVERPITDDERRMIKKLMTDQSQRFCRAWYVENADCRARFDAYCEEHGLSEKDGTVQFLWHGTGADNIWSIEKVGLYLNPAVVKSDVRICGKAYGYGIYTAPYCYKSMAYATSSFGEGRHAHGYLLLCRVAVGKPYFINRDPHAKRPNHWGDFHKDHPDCGCCWAEAGQTADLSMMRLRWDEVIVYQEQQIVPTYLVEYTA